MALSSSQRLVLIVLLRAPLGVVLVSSSPEDERRVAQPLQLQPGGRVGKFTLVERVQSLPASFSLPPPTIDAPHEVAVLGGGGAAAWLDVLALSDAPNANETDSLALLDLFSSSTTSSRFAARCPEPLQPSLPAPLPSASFDANAQHAAQHALPRPFEEELESIAANRRYRLHRPHPHPHLDPHLDPSPNPSPNPDPDQVPAAPARRARRARRGVARGAHRRRAAEAAHPEAVARRLGGHARRAARAALRRAAPRHAARRALRGRLRARGQPVRTAPQLSCVYIYTPPWVPPGCSWQGRSCTG